MDVCTDQQTISQDWSTEDVFINQQEISHDWPTEDIYIDQQEISEEWPTKESFKRREISKWRDSSDDIYKIKKVSHRKGKFGNSAILTLKTKNGEVVYPGFNKYHLIVRGLFKNLKASFIIFKLLASLKYYERSFKILK